MKLKSARNSYGRLLCSHYFSTQEREFWIFICRLVQHSIRQNGQIKNKKKLYFVCEKNGNESKCKRFLPFPSFYKRFAFFHAKQMMVNRISNWNKKKGFRLRRIRPFLVIYWFYGQRLVYKMPHRKSNMPFYIFYRAMIRTDVNKSLAL